MRKRIVYIAGTYRAGTGAGVRANIARAADIFAELLRKGFVAIFPHTMTAEFDYLYPDISDQCYLDTDIELLKLCDAVVLTPGWEISKGTEAEIREAKNAGIPVFEKIGDMVGHFERFVEDPFGDQ